MKGPQMWPKSIITCKYYGKTSTGKKIGEFWAPGAEIWLFKKKIWTVPLILHFNISRCIKPHMVWNTFTEFCNRKASKREHPKAAEVHQVVVNYAVQCVMRWCARGKFSAVGEDSIKMRGGRWAERNLPPGPSWSPTPGLLPHNCEMYLGEIVKHRYW